MRGATGLCCSEVISVAGNPFPAFGLRDANGVRASEVEHAVQDPDRDGDFGVPHRGPAEPQAVADDAFPAAEERLDQGADVVSRVFLPRQAAVLGNVLEVPVALGTAVERGGTTTAASRVCAATVSVTPAWS